MSTSHLPDLGTVIAELERQGRLIRIRSEVDPHLDLAGIAARFEGGPRAVLFEKVRGYRDPIFTGLYWSRDLLAALLRCEARSLPHYVSQCIRRWQQAPRPPVLLDDGPIYAVREAGLTLDDVPLPVHAERDGGPYSDAGVVIARDPDTGVRNASIQRFMKVDAGHLTCNIDPGRHLELYLDKAMRRGERLAISINCGVGPGAHFAAATPAEAAPADTDELGIVAEFDGAPLELVEGKVLPVHSMARAMYVIEAEFLPGEVDEEGPFAEVTGYYAQRARRQKLRVRAVHRRPDAVFQTILSGAEVHNSVGLLGESNVLALLQRQVPGVLDVYFSHGGCGFYHCIVQMRQTRRGWSKQAIMAAFAAFPPLKMVTVVDEDVDIRNAQDVEWALVQRLDARTGIIRIEDCFGHGLNPTFPDHLGTKLGFDACRPIPRTPQYDRVSYKPVDLTEVDYVLPDIEPVAGAPSTQSDGSAGGAAM